MTTKTTKTEEKWVDYVSPKGYIYTVRQKDKDLKTVAEVIRSMTADGYNVSAIAKLTGIRYQMVRNYVNEPVRRRVQS